MTDQQIISWYRRRYTPELIKQMQTALNRQALGALIAVDGKIGPLTLAAIRNFQRQYSDILKVDGMVGDQTASALGMTGYGDLGLPPTRKGLPQGRVQTKALSPAELAEKNYYTSPEMTKWMLNAANAKRSDYAGHYQKALKYVSPEIASRLRYINDDGDEYDATVSANHNLAVKRNQGILETKNAIASGYLKPNGYDKWMTDHNLSTLEMLEILEDPDAIQAQHTAGVRADIGRLNSLQAQDRRFLQGVTDAMNETGTKYALPAMMTLAGGPAGFASAIGSLAGGAVVNLATDAISDGKYNTWGLMLYDVTETTNPYGQYAWEMTNPGYWAMPGTTLATRKTKWGPTTYKYKGANPNAGKEVFVPGYDRVVGKKLGYKVYEGPGHRWDFPGSEGTLKHVKGHSYKIGDKKTFKFKAPGGEKINTTVPTFGVAPYTPNKVESGLGLTVPTYDKGVTYAPYLGYNRTTQTEEEFPSMLQEVEVVAPKRKEGGTLNYLEYLNK